MSTAPVLNRLNGLLYRREFARLSAQDRTLARTWMLQFLKINHPDWTKQTIEREYERLLHCRPVAVDEWSRRMT
ncbi:MAG: hypothetical protein EBZ83_01380 [Verrucomicrobia bacterium]|jgi:hypothetical protein|nr:hypothetical protein [Verrucomicrobiota bacterium]NBR63396.1 hypothetical protein [Verrucomicrobiota bacterium]NBU69461.1 hypothetical protein [Verrucomicrobiota bacterium]NDC00066.1 hypothetical protein [Verrucomicrobiota bacterium]NDF16575.1 hypothetical protein [Verrucomicrobiota bacterium]